MRFKNHFHKTGSSKIYSPVGLISITLTSIFLGLIFGINTSFLAFIPIIFAAAYFLNVVIKAPRIALITLFSLSFFAIGLTRLVPLPFGLAIDILLVLVFIILFFRSFGGANWYLKNNSLTNCTFVWMLYCCLEIFNPEAESLAAWFYAVRGLAMYPFLFAPLVFLVLNKQKDYKLFINLWFGISIFLGLYGAKQYWLGLFHFEQVWLDTEGFVTHVLWGKFTRMFSFSSDANQYGQSMAHVAVVAIILSIGVKQPGRKLFFILTGAAGLLGMILSGTRGAIVIPIIGFGVYFLLSKNYKVLIFGSLTGGVVMYILVFTFIAHGLAPVRRMRTAFNVSDDKSYLVRLENRANLEKYLEKRPFGGGVGSAGVWGNRFTPGTFLADFQTDGHYVRIRAETGTVGLYLYYLLHIIIIGKMVIITLKLKEPKLQNTMNGLTAGAIAVMVANYSAAVTVALPTNIILYWSMAVVYMSPLWDKGKEHPLFNEYVAPEDRLK